MTFLAGSMPTGSCWLHVLPWRQAVPSFSLPVVTVARAKVYNLIEPEQIAIACFGGVDTKIETEHPVLKTTPAVSLTRRLSPGLRSFINALATSRPPGPAIGFTFGIGWASVSIQEVVVAALEHWASASSVEATALHQKTIRRSPGASSRPRVVAVDGDGYGAQVLGQDDGLGMDAGPRPASIAPAEPHRRTHGRPDGDRPPEQIAEGERRPGASPQSICGAGASIGDQWAAPVAKPIEQHGWLRFGADLGLAFHLHEVFLSGPWKRRRELNQQNPIEPTIQLPLPPRPADPLFVAGKPVYLWSSYGRDNVWIERSADSIYEQTGHQPALQEILLGCDLSRYNWIGRGAVQEHRLAVFTIGQSRPSPNTRGLELATLRQHVTGNGIVGVFGWDLSTWTSIDIDARIPAGHPLDREDRVGRLLEVVAIIKRLFPHSILEARYDPVHWRASMTAKGPWSPVLELDDDRLVHHHPLDPSSGIAGVHTWIRWAGWHPLDPLNRHLVELLRRSGIKEVAPTRPPGSGQPRKPVADQLRVEVRPLERNSMTLPLRVEREEAGFSLGYQLVDEHLIPLVVPMRRRQSGSLRWLTPRQLLAENWKILNDRWLADRLPAARPALSRIPDRVVFGKRTGLVHGSHMSQAWIEVREPRQLLEQPLHEGPWPRVRIPEAIEIPSLRPVSEPAPSTSTRSGRSKGSPGSQPDRPGADPTALLSMKGVSSGRGAQHNSYPIGDPFTAGLRNEQIGAIVRQIKAQGGTELDAAAAVRAAHVGATCHGTVAESLKDLRRWWITAKAPSSKPTNPQLLALARKKVSALVRDRPPPGYADSKKRMYGLIVKIVEETTWHPDYAAQYSFGYKRLEKAGFTSSRQMTAVKKYLASLGCRRREEIPAGKGALAERWDVRPMLEMLGVGSPATVSSRG